MKKLLIGLSFVSGLLLTSTAQAHKLGSCPGWENQKNFELLYTRWATEDDVLNTENGIILKNWNALEQKLVAIFAKEYKITKFDELTAPSYRYVVDKTTGRTYADIYFIGDDGDHFGVVLDVKGELMVKFYGIDHFMFCSEDFQKPLK